MGKKYLLYIHNESFGLEEHKSKLVNSLLDKHYKEQGKPNVYTSKPVGAKNVYTINKPEDVLMAVRAVSSRPIEPLWRDKKKGRL